MKQVIKNYSFSPSSKTITLTDFSTIRLDRILLITDVTNNITIYQFNNASLGGTVSTNVLTLDYNTNTGSFNSGDSLQIFYDVITGDPTYDTPVLPLNAAKETGGNLATIAGNIPAKGQATMANSTPVVIASNQSGVPITYDQPALSTATWTTATSINTALSNTSTAGHSTATVTAVETGTTTTAGALTFEVYDGTNWWAIAGQALNSMNPPASSYTLVNNTNAAWSFNIAGYQGFRVRLSTAMTGTGSPQVVVILQIAAGDSIVGPVVGVGQQLDSTNDSISAWTKGLTYTKVSASGVVVSGTCVFYGYTCEASSTGTAIFYDNTAASGNTILGGTAQALTVGTNVILSQGITCATGLYFSLGGTSATLNVLTRNVSK